MWLRVPVVRPWLLLSRIPWQRRHSLTMNLLKDSCGRFQFGAFGNKAAVNSCPGFCVGINFHFSRVDAQE